MTFNYKVRVKVETLDTKYNKHLRHVWYEFIFTCTGGLLKDSDYFIQMINVDNIMFRYKENSAPTEAYTDIPFDKPELTKILKNDRLISMSLPSKLRQIYFNYNPQHASIIYSLFEKSGGAITVQTKDGSFLQNGMTVSVDEL